MGLSGHGSPGFIPEIGVKTTGSWTNTDANVPGRRSSASRTA